VDVPLPRDITDLFTLGPDAPFDVAIHHLEPHLVNLPLAEKQAARKNIYWSMWEWESLDSQPWSETFAERLSNFDKVVVYDSGSYGAFLPYVGEDRLLTVQGGYQSDLWAPGAKLTNPTFVFGMNGKLTLRKGVYTAYSAFNLLKDNHGDDFDAKLILKTITPIFPPGFTPAEGVKEILGYWLPPKLKAFYQQIDCLLCPSWGEGKNLPALEALTCGTPVVLSDIPAHRQWAHSGIVTWAATEPKALMPGQVGGYVSPEELAEKMWHQYTNRSQEAAKARLASAEVVKSMDWSKSLERLSLQAELML
jgi:glycosyltransferase involved in cell wall biosynthesis